jgi:hypothetical protein
MSKKIFTLILACFLLSSCALHWTQKISDQLENSKDIYYSYNTKPINFKPDNKCESLSLKIINNEKRNEDINVGDIDFRYYSINPKILTDNIVSYINNAYNKCNVTIKDDSTKSIYISIKKAELQMGTFNRGAALELNVSIPDIQYNRSYSASTGTGGMRAALAMAYAIHEVTWQIIQDPVTKNYILCEDEAASKSLSQKLQELKTALDNGLITKEEYQLKRKALIEKY